MNILFIIIVVLLSVLSLLFILICGYDLLLHYSAMYKRRKIGTLSENEWIIRVKKVAFKWLKKMPELKLTNNTSYALIEKISGKNKSSNFASWQKAALVLGLYENGEEVDTAPFINSKGEFETDYSGVDSAMLAYALLKACENKEALKPAMDKTFKLVKSFCDEDGLIQYNNKKGNFYVDALGLVCPFLAEYGSAFGNKQAEEMCVKQLIFYSSNGLCEKNFLPNHCIKKDGTPLSVYAWGRGCAWYALGLIDSYEYLSESAKKQVLPLIKDFANVLLKYSLKDGGFSNLLTVSGYDSSAPAALGFFLARAGKILGNYDYILCADKCLKKLVSYTMKSGEIDASQGDTHGIGNFSTFYDIMPFTQGMALRLYKQLN